MDVSFTEAVWFVVAVFSTCVASLHVYHLALKFRMKEGFRASDFLVLGALIYALQSSISRYWFFSWLSNGQPEWMLAHPVPVAAIFLAVPAGALMISHYPKAMIWRVSLIMAPLSVGLLLAAS